MMSVYLNYNKNRILTPIFKKIFITLAHSKGRERGVQIPPIIWVFMQVGARVLPGLIPKAIKYNLGNGRARPRVLWTWSRMAICSNWWCWRVVVWSECRVSLAFYKWYSNFRNRFAWIIADNNGNFSTQMWKFLRSLMWCGRRRLA